MDAKPSQRFRIGDWWADRATNELGRGDRIVRIEPKAMEVLMVLAEQASTVVTREELLARVWPGVVVGEEALTQAIIKLRKALGGNARVPEYIQTISKRGYRLIAAVRHDDVNRPAAIAAEEPDPSAPLHRAWPLRSAKSAMLLGVVVLAISIAAWYALDQFLDASAAVADIDVRNPGGLDQPGIPTLAVLPFESLGGSQEQRDLARAIGSDLTTDLSRLSGVRLIGVTGDLAVAPAAARYVVAGTLQQEARTLRINIRLSDTRSSEVLWSERFERPYADLFAVQTDIGRTISERLLGKLTEAEARRVAKRSTQSLDAYGHFVRAQSLFLVRRLEANEEARAFYMKALEADPKFARAYAGLAMTHAMEYRYRKVTDSASLDRALELAESARDIDPDIPEIHWALGFVHTQRRRHDHAIRSLRKAIELNPSYADAYALMGGCYTYIGQPARSIPLLRTAQRLNPDGGSLYYLLLGRAYLFEGDVDQALINLREAQGRNAENLETRIFLTAALVASDNRPAAEWEADQINAAEPGFSARNWLKTYPMTSVRQQKRLLALLASVNL